MSTKRAKATVRSWIDAWGHANLDAVDDLFAPDYAVNGNEVTPEGVKQAIVWLHATFGNPVLTVDDIVAEADRVAVRWTLRGSHEGPFNGIAATGKPVTLSGINIYRLAGGKIKENHESVDVYGLLMQLGATFAPSKMAG
jgi:steroid delta-isomerase-like uncharacterized protein